MPERKPGVPRPPTRHVMAASNLRNIAHVPKSTATAYGKAVVRKGHPGCTVECRCRTEGHRWKIRLTIRWAGLVMLQPLFDTPAEAWDYATTYARMQVRAGREDPKIMVQLDRNARSSDFGDGVIQTGGLQSPKGLTYTVEVIV